ncbi:MAG: serine hydrolase domain-containing protein [Ilumatobacteraceae bacterium]
MGARDPSGVLATFGPLERPFRLASISKVISAYATLIAVEEGVVSLTDPVGQDGCTLEHLLAHAGGYGFEGEDPVGRPGARRIYSNTGYELLAQHVEVRAEMPFSQYVHEAVCLPLGLGATDVTGSPAKGFISTLAELLVVAAELQRPTLLSAATWDRATTPAFAELSGIVPGVGRFVPCPWGLGPELRGDKQPHWTGTTNSSRTFGHFGGSGTFVWVDPAAELAVVALTDREFGEWALEVWPPLSDAALAAHAAPSGSSGSAGSNGGAP